MNDHIEFNRARKCYTVLEFGGGGAMVSDHSLASDNSLCLDVDISISTEKKKSDQYSAKGYNIS